jgi:hypothetical protein
MSTGVDLGDIRKQAYREYLEKWSKGQLSDTNLTLLD